jgi:thiamine-phosphate pyrophosphorylase
LKLPPIYAITDRQVSGVSSHAEIARRLLAVGVRCVQVREKAMPDRALLSQVEGAARLGRGAGALVIVNDRVDIARVAGTGVHLGEDDLPAAEARRMLPEGATIGVSTHDLEAARRAFGDPACDYVAFGPVYESGTKNVRQARGLEALAAAAALKTRPLVAIGGITAETLPGVLDAGADAAAMIGGLLSGGSIEDNARKALDAARRSARPGRIFLVGFMGCGKTTVGRRVADRLELPFVDLDEEIERVSGLTVRAFFEASGEAAFRERETLFLAGVEALPAAVVATGGGSFVSQGNRDLVRGLGTALFLDVPFSAVARRLHGKTDRPLFRDPEQAARLYAERAPFYRMGSIPVTLEGGETVDEAADRVLIALDGRQARA